MGLWLMKREMSHINVLGFSGRSGRIGAETLLRHCTLSFATKGRAILGPVLPARGDWRRDVGNLSRGVPASLFSTKGRACYVKIVGM